MIVDLPFAPLSVLAFLGTCLFVVAMFAVTVYFQVSGKPQRARKMLELLAGGIALYTVALIGTSLFSKEYLLGRGAEKHFCEMDCHLAYSVTKVEQVTVTPEFSIAPEYANSTYWAVTLRTRFDEKTIGPHRGNGLLFPNPRKIYVVDEQGRSYPMAASSGVDLSKPLRPGEWYETRLVFGLPQDARSPRMFVRNSPFPNSLLIGHENSPLHRKVYFDLRS